MAGVAKPLGSTFCRGSFRSFRFLAGQLSCQKLNFEKNLSLLTENIIGLYSATTSSKTTPEIFQTIETLRLRFFDIPRTANVNKSREQSLAVRFAVWVHDCTARPKFQR